MKKRNGNKTRTAWLAVALAVLVCTDGARADFTFGEAVNLGPNVNSSTYDAGACVTSDGLELYFVSLRAGGLGDSDIWVSKRPTKDDDWGEPINLGPVVNSAFQEDGASLTGDDLELYFCSNRPGGYGGGDIWVTRRETRDSDWGQPVHIGAPANNEMNLWSPSVSPDGLELYATTVDGGSASMDLWVIKRASREAPWGAPVNLGIPVNSIDRDMCAAVGPDGLTLFFSSWRSNSNFDLWMARRETKQNPWGEPIRLGPGINSPYSDMVFSVSSDGHTLYFWDRESEGTRPGGYGQRDSWQAPIIPIVDFNGDALVDIEDLLTMIDNLGTSESLCDIGPMPWGDGIVDKADVEVLMSYYGQAVGLVAHWKLDELEGAIAHDSVAGYDGTVEGDAVWQPDGGAIDGALQLDGLDDCVETPLVLNPSAAPFSVFAWLQGGAPGQVILCQDNGAEWLLVEAGGVLATELASGGTKDVLISEGSITDGNWHRVGLTWDGMTRTLYVDDVKVAEDTQNYLAGQDTVLYLGASGPGNRFRGATFFVGLIDDVRIYNRAVKP